MRVVGGGGVKGGLEEGRSFSLHHHQKTPWFASFRKKSTLCPTVSMFQYIYVPLCHCSTVSCLCSTMSVSYSIYVLPYLCSAVSSLCSTVSMFHHIYLHRVYVPPPLCSTMDMFPRVYAPTYLFSTVSDSYNTTLLPSVNTLVARGMFCGDRYTHHTFTPS